MDEKNNHIVTGKFKKPLFLKKIAHKKVGIGILCFVILCSLLGGIAYLKYKTKPIPAVDCQEHIDKLTTESEHKNYASVVDLSGNYIKENCPSDQKVALIRLKATALLFQGKPDEAEPLFKRVEVMNGGKLDVSSALSLAAISYKKGDKEAAIKYYKVLIQATRDTPDTTDDAWIPQYNTIIKNLGGTP